MSAGVWAQLHAESLKNGEAAYTPRAALEEVKRLRGLIREFSVSMKNNVNVLLREAKFTCTEIQNMSEAERAEHKRIVIEAMVKREKKRKRAQKKAAIQGDYSRGICGTAEDTSVEKEMSELSKVGSGKVENRESPYVLPVEGSEEELRIFRNDPKAWKKILGASDVWIYLNVFTHEMCGLRPECYEDEYLGENEAGEKEQEDPTCGLETVGSDDLLDAIEMAIEDRRTTLILDPSNDEIMRTYFSYKGVVCDLSLLAKSLGEQRREGITPKKVFQEARKKIVQAAKAGSTLAVILGSLGKEHISLKDKACRKPLGGDKVFPSGLFVAAGKDLITSRAKGVKPEIEKLFTKDDKEGGVCVFRDKFNVVFVSSHLPKDYVEELQHSVPLDRMKVLYLKTDRV
jgi:hypothetical protein